jgi:hypothetical protein
VIILGCALAVILILAVILWFRYIKGQKNVNQSEAVMENKSEGAENSVVPKDKVQCKTTPPQKGIMSPSEMDTMSHRESDAATVFSRTRSNAAELAEDISPVTSPPGELPSGAVY